MLPDTNPQLTDEQIKQLEDARKLIPSLKAQIRLAKQAGIDVTQQEKDLDEMQTQLDKLYRVYVRKFTVTGIPQ